MLVTGWFALNPMEEYRYYKHFDISLWGGFNWKESTYKRLRLYYLESIFTPWHATAEGATSRRTWASRIIAGKGWLDLHRVPLVTSNVWASPLIEPLNRLLSQSAWGIMRHEMGMLWWGTSISSVQILSWGRTTHLYMRKCLDRSGFSEIVMKWKTENVEHEISKAVLCQNQNRKRNSQRKNVHFILNIQIIKARTVRVGNWI